MLGKCSDRPDSDINGSGEKGDIVEVFSSELRIANE
jgi:hypothetical protein